MKNKEKSQVSGADVSQVVKDQHIHPSSFGYPWKHGQWWPKGPRCSLQGHICYGIRVSGPSARQSSSGDWIGGKWLAQAACIGGMLQYSTAYMIASITVWNTMPRRCSSHAYYCCHIPTTWALLLWRSEERLAPDLYQSIGSSSRCRLMASARPQENSRGCTNVAA